MCICRQRKPTKAARTVCTYICRHLGQPKTAQTGHKTTRNDPRQVCTCEIRADGVYVRHESGTYVAIWRRQRGSANPGREPCKGPYIQ